MAKLASLKAQTRLLDRRAADQIRSHILEGILPAGQRLLETKLSEDLEVSRGTVRSAPALADDITAVQRTLGDVDGPSGGATGAADTSSGSGHNTENPAAAEGDR